MNTPIATLSLDFPLPEYEGDEGDGDDQEIQQVESRATEGSRMQNEAVGNDFQAHFNGENRREKVIEIVQDLEKKEERC